MDELRLVKDEKEIALMREAGAITATATTDAMRATRPGMKEYELDAALRYRFIQRGARDEGYCAIIPSGDNIRYAHYSANQNTLMDGGWVLLDGAPDYHYYTSDIGRMWPINGTFSSEQRIFTGTCCGITSRSWR